jgi:hypothetical protein
VTHPLALEVRKILNRVVVVGGATSTPPLGINLYSVMIDDCNFCPSPGSGTDVRHELNAATKGRKPDMVIIAEQAMSRREIIDRLTREAERYVEARVSYVAQADVVKVLQGVCDQCHWSNYQRRKTVEQIAARVCRRAGVFRVVRRPPPPPPSD